MAIENTGTPAQIDSIASLLRDEGLDDGYTPDLTGGQGADQNDALIDSVERVHRQTHGNDDSEHPLRGQREGVGDEGRSNQTDAQRAPAQSVDGFDPKQLHDPRALQARKEWVVNEARMLQEAFAQNLITAEQYQVGQGIALGLAGQIQEAELTIQRYEIAQHRAVEQFHEETSTLIPEWGNKDSRANLQHQLGIWLDSKNIPRELRAMFSHPATVALAVSAMRAEQNQKVANIRQIQEAKKRKEAQRSAPTRNEHPRSVGEQAAAVSELLMRLGS
jgi:hypothetical protein